MATLVVLKFETADGAEKAISLAESLQKQEMLQLVDAAAVTWPVGKKKPKTKQLRSTTGAGALGGAFWGMLFGLIFFIPFFGLAVGAAMGALAGHFADYGIDDKFIKQVRDQVTEGTSAVFLMVGAVTLDKVVDAFKTQLPKFEVISTNLSKEQEEKLIAEFGEQE